MFTRGSVLAILGAVLAISACDPFGLPATRALEGGAADTLGAGNTFEVVGEYTAAGTRWRIDLQVAGPSTRHVLVTSNSETVEAIVVGPDAYYRGEAFLARHLSGNPIGASLAKAAGSAWWRDRPGQAPTLPDFTDGAAFRTTFLGSAVTQRVDPHNGVSSVVLSGTRADVFISPTPPFYLQEVRLKSGVEVDGITDADFVYSNPGKDFHIAAPTDLIDFANLSTLPPIYTVVSVDTSQCASPCVVSARVKNLGGTTGARGRSTVSFVLQDRLTGQTQGTCAALVQPDVGYNSTTTVSCTIDAVAVNGAEVTATADNPGRA
jgi:hypothetical protein